MKYQSAISQVWIDLVAHQKLWAWTRMAKGEVSMLGLVEDTADGPAITDLFLMRQTCTSASTDMDQADIARLSVERVVEKLAYVDRALRILRRELGDETALLGFSGSPWTLANFMIEGGGVKEYTKAKALFYSDRPLLEQLLEKLTQAVSDFLQLQIDAGADAVQIFDSLGGVLSEADFAAASGRWMKQIVGSLRGKAPVIVFSKGTHGSWDELVATGAQVLGVDWNVRLADVRARLPDRVGVQGNLDPFLLTTTPAVVAAETSRVLREMRGRPGHIFNLGHGVPPNAKLENIESLVSAVRSFK